GGQLPAGATEVHAPTAAVRTVRAEDRDQVGPAVRGQRLGSRDHPATSSRTSAADDAARACSASRSASARDVDRTACLTSGTLAGTTDSSVTPSPTSSGVIAVLPASSPQTAI